MARRLEALDHLPESRRRILLVLKHRGRATTMELAAELSVSHEAVRRHLIQLGRDGFIKPHCADGEDEARAWGRPAVTYCLTPAGDHFFPKRYDELAMLFIDAVSAGASGEIEILDHVTRQRSSRLGAKSDAKLSERVRAIRNVYLERDTFLEVERDGKDYLIVEKNCPFLNVALERPVICSTTVSVLRKVLGLEVVREERFQDEDGRCKFRALSDRPVGARRRRGFELEPPKDAAQRMK